MTLSGGILTLAATAALGAPNEPALAVLNLEVSGIEARFGSLLTDIVTSEVAKHTDARVIAGNEIDAMLGFEERKMIVGCDDASCYSDIAGALGADRIVVGEIGKIGDTFVVNLKLINVRKAMTEGRVSETVTGDDDVLVPAVREAVEELFEAANIAPPPVEETVTGDDGASGFPGPGPFVTWGVGLAGVVAGVIFGSMAKGHADLANGTGLGTQVEVENAQSDQLLANVLIPVGAVVIALGFVWWLLEGDDEPPAMTGLNPIIGGVTW